MDARLEPEWSQIRGRWMSDGVDGCQMSDAEGANRDRSPGLASAGFTPVLKDRLGY
jgi:hypothetical protein